MKYIKVMGIILIVMTFLSFILTLIIPNFLVHSLLIFLVSYGLLGYLVRQWAYPYFSGYIIACTLVILNTIFGNLILGIPLLFTPEIVFWSFVFAISVTMLSVYSFRKIKFGGEVDEGSGLSLQSTNT